MLQLRILNKPTDWPAEAAKLAEKAENDKATSALKMKDIKAGKRSPDPIIQTEEAGTEEEITEYEQQRLKRICINKEVRNILLL